MRMAAATTNYNVSWHTVAVESIIAACEQRAQAVEEEQ